MRRMVVGLLGWYLRHSPDHAGRWRLIEPAVKLAPSLRTMRSARVVRGREGFRMRVDGSSQTGRILYATGEYERGTTLVIKRLLRPGQTMIDVGGNLGYFSILGARAVGPRGRVVAFEPVERVRRQLLDNVRLNGLENVTVREEALARASGEATFYPGPADDTGLASLRPLEHSTAITLKQARLDDLWPPGDPIALIKMDVEGAELSALEGMDACLAAWSPHLIVEVTDEYLRTLGASAEMLFTFLQTRNYTMKRIADDGSLVAVAAASQLSSCPPQFNALCTKELK